MNPNANEVLLYMIIHFLIFLFKSIIKKFNICNFYNKKEDKELELMKKNLNSLKEQIKEISPSNELAKYTKIERQINKLSSDISIKEISNQLENDGQNQNLFNKIFNYLNPFTPTSFMYSVNLIEYILLKNKYLEVDYQNNKNNIIAKHYYNENDNKYYSLITVCSILFIETFVLNSIADIISKFINLIN